MTHQIKMTRIASSVMGLCRWGVLAGVVTVFPLPALGANECAPVGTTPSDNGAAADTFACSGNYTGAGISYNSDGALTVNSTDNMNVGVNGISLQGNGADSVDFTATGTVTGTSGAVIDITSASGDINVSTAGVTGTGVNVTHGIQAVSSGGGNVKVSTAGIINVTSTVGTAQQQSAIRAVSTGGNGNVEVRTIGNVTGRLHAIQAQASGSGALTIVADSAAGSIYSIAASSTVGVAAIDAVTGTGLLTIDLRANSGTGNSSIQGGQGSAIRAEGGGDVLIDISRKTTILNGKISPALIDVFAAGQTTLNNSGDIGVLAIGTSNTQMVSAGYVAVRAGGGAFTLNNNAWFSGRVNLSGVTGASIVNNNPEGRWTTRGVSDFGAGENIVNNAGILSVAGPTVFNGLDVFNNSRLITFRREGLSDVSARVLSMPGTSFVGTDVSRLEMAAILGTAGQTSCATATVADCLDLRGGSTSGTTTIILSQVGSVTTQANPDGIVLVDVSGGTSHAGDFLIDNRTAGYADDPVYGGMIRADGWLGFALQYNAATQQHVLNTVVPTKKLEYLAAPQSVLSIWHTTSDSIAGRQADLRDRGEAGAWLRVTGGSGSRDVGVGYTADATAYRIDDKYTLDTTTAIGGFDLAYGELGSGNYIFGFHAGAVRGSLERQSSPTTDEIDGTTLGVYGSWWGQSLTLDATINTNFLTLEQDRPATEISSTSVQSVGFRTEAGWRLPMGASFYLQPLASLAYVKSSIKKVVQTSFEAQWSDIDSLRAALGVRMGGDLMAGKAKLGYWLTARAWNESGADTVVTIKTPVEDVTMANDLGGSFQEVGLGVNVSNQKGTLNVFASGNTQFASGMDDYNLSLGARLRW